MPIELVIMIAFIMFVFCFICAVDGPSVAAALFFAFFVLLSIWAYVAMKEPCRKEVKIYQIQEIGNVMASETDKGLITVNDVIRENISTSDQLEVTTEFCSNRGVVISPTVSYKLIRNSQEQNK